jgi:hypothetical protein
LLYFNSRRNRLKEGELGMLGGEGRAYRRREGDDEAKGKRIGEER